MTVTDTGVPQLTSTAEITVNVININDNDPVFNETEYKFYVHENSAKGTSIGHIYAKDADDGKKIFHYQNKLLICLQSLT